MCAVHVHNRTLTKSSHKSMRRMTPFEIIIGKKPNIIHLRILGTPVKVTKPKRDVLGKLNTKIWNGINVGYSHGGAYRISVPYFVTRDVQFFEKLYREVGVAEKGRNFDRALLNTFDYGMETDDEDAMDEKEAVENDVLDIAADVNGGNEKAALDGQRRTQSGRAVRRPVHLDKYTTLDFLTTDPGAAPNGHGKPVVSEVDGRDA